MHASSNVNKSPWLVPLCLLALYFIWGSTFIGMKFAIESFPPYLMASLRFLAAGGVLYAGLRLRGVPAPSKAEWRGVFVVGTLLLAGGNAGVAYAQQWVDSGASAMVIATVPIWVALLSGIWKDWPRPQEWAGIVIGLLGVVILTLDGNLRASPLGAAVLVFAAIAWGLGSVLGKRVAQPDGAMASAAQMLAGGAVLMGISWIKGEPLPVAVSPKAGLALLYLTVFGSLVAYSAYLYLLKTVRPALATSYAFVNPLVAMALGVWLAGERISQFEWIAMATILIGVLLVLLPAGSFMAFSADSADR